MFDAEGLDGGDLDVIDVPPVPERLENGVRETEHEDVLHGFLGKVMVDAENLAFLIVGMHEFIQLPGRGEVVAEGFFDHDMAAALVLALQTRGPDVVDHLFEHRGRDGQIKNAVPARLVPGLELRQDVR